MGGIYAAKAWSYRDDRQWGGEGCSLEERRVCQKEPWGEHVKRHDTTPNIAVTRPVVEWPEQDRIRMLGNLTLPVYLLRTQVSIRSSTH